MKHERKMYNNIIFVGLKLSITYIFRNNPIILPKNKFNRFLKLSEKLLISSKILVVKSQIFVLIANVVFFNICENI